jgi:hypothetical protein
LKTQSHLPPARAADGIGDRLVSGTGNDRFFRLLLLLVFKHLTEQPRDRL